tara:strand:- start:1154 stop:1876 length:723 start_codon:yes stop_codon:yes gene_type:complete
LANSLTKTKLIDPFILSLVNNIGEKRSLLDNLESIKINPDFLNIVSDTKDNHFYIQNQFHKAKGFRRLHVEIAEFSNSLKILHCVFFPDPIFNIPIFGLDLVKVNDKITAAIVDLSPVSSSVNLELESLLKKANKDDFGIKRKIPEWGEIFSKHVFFASLKNKEDQKNFYNTVDNYMNILVTLTKDILPDQEPKSIQERIYFQKRYCIQQMKNEKTSMVLLKYFDKKWVDRYIREILFDF